MRILKLILILLLVGSAFVTANAQATKEFKDITPPRQRVFNPESKGKPEEEIEELEHRLSDAWLKRDVASLNEIHSTDVLVNGLTGSKEAYIGFVLQSMGDYTAIEKSKMQIRFHGDTAVVTGQLVVDSKIPNGSNTSFKIFMNVWKKQSDGKWKVIASA